MGRIWAVCISPQRGTQKTAVDGAMLIEDSGIDGDAHAGKWHRQVSLISRERIEAFKQRGAQVEDGAFGENIIVEGIDCGKLPVGTRLRCNETVLEITQIGKECHAHCQIYRQVGDCIMPREGVFAVVLRGGRIARGDEISVMTDGR